LWAVSGVLMRLPHSQSDARADKSSRASSSQGAEERSAVKDRPSEKVRTKVKGIIRSGVKEGGGSAEGGNATWRRPLVIPGLSIAFLSFSQERGQIFSKTLNSSINQLLCFHQIR